MLNKTQASKVSPLVANKEAWDSLDQYLQEQIQMTLRALVAAQSAATVPQGVGRDLREQPADDVDGVRRRADRIPQPALQVRLSGNAGVSVLELAGDEFSVLT